MSSLDPEKFPQYFTNEAVVIDKLDDIIVELKSNGNKLERLIDHATITGDKIDGIYQHALKYLLITVCVVALGREGISLISQLIHGNAAAAAVTEANHNG